MTKTTTRNSTSSDYTTVVQVDLPKRKKKDYTTVVAFQKAPLIETT